MAPMEDDLPPPPPPGAGAQDYDDDDEYEDDPYPDDLPPIPPVGFAPEPEQETKIVSPLKAWIGLFLIMVLTGLTGFVFQKDIMVAYPPSMKVYSMLGMDPDILGHGLDIPQPLAEHELVDDKRQLIVSGEIVNATDEIKEVPTLKGELLNAQGDVLFVWTFEVDQKEVLPGEAGKYETRVKSMPRGATGIKVTFISPEELEELRMLRGDAPMDEKMEMKDGEG